ncbi:MAG: LysM peptidoglycan-binding domain-containing protein [Flavobacteriaceae bacterium]
MTRFNEPFFASSDYTGSVPQPSEPVGAAAYGPANGGYAQPTDPVYSSQPLPPPGGSQASTGAPVGAGGTIVKTVANGDTLFSIARAYGVSEQAILDANRMQSADQIRVGQRLIIPSPGAGARYGAASTPSYSPPAYAASSPQPAPAAPRTAQNGRYRVQPGDTLYSIARNHNVGVAEISRANSLPSGGAIRVGQELVIPGEGPVRTARLETTRTMTDASEARPPRVAAAPVRDDSGTKTVRTVPIAAPQPKAEPVAAAPEATPQPAEQPQRVASLGEPEARSASEFRWPVRGRVISAFGEKASGRTNDGVNIAVPAGTSIRAAENGVVAYAGNELEGYGNLILIRHSDNWVTAYAHAEKLLVKRGDTVKRGQVIAQAGQTGSVSTPQVHFELRQGSKPVDPLRHLSAL